MHDNHSVTLGISLGTRLVGIALFEGSTLVEWQTKAFPKHWSEKKLQEMCTAIRAVISHRALARVAIKVPPAPYASYPLQLLEAEIAAYTREKHIPVTCYGDIRSLFTNCTNKAELLSTMVNRYPSLKNEYEKEITKKHRYYLKLFEAVAVGHLAITADKSP
jgi:hypothetical protein